MLHLAVALEASSPNSQSIQLSMNGGESRSSHLKTLGVLLPSGAERDRTVDLRLAKPALYPAELQPQFGHVRRCRRCVSLELVGQGRLELPTSRLSGVRSNHLSYWPDRAKNPDRVTLRLLGAARHGRWAMLLGPSKLGCIAYDDVTLTSR